MPRGEVDLADRQRRDHRGEAHQAGQHTLQTPLFVRAYALGHQGQQRRLADPAEAEERKQKKDEKTPRDEGDGDISRAVADNRGHERAAFTPTLAQGAGDKSLGQRVEQAETSERQADGRRIPAELVLTIEHPDGATDLSDDGQEDGHEEQRHQRRKRTNPAQRRQWMKGRRIDPLGLRRSCLGQRDKRNDEIHHHQNRGRDERRT